MVAHPPLSQPAPAGRSTTDPDNIRGILWMLVSVVGASAMSVAVRELSTDVDSRMIVVLRSAIIMAGLAVALIVLPKTRDMHFSRPGLHILRGGLIGLSTHLGFYTLANLPLATTTVLFFTAPIFATILSVIFQGERVGLRRAAAVAAGFVGAAIILRPGLQPFEPAMLAALASSAMFAVALTLSRGLVAADGANSAYMSSVVITLLVSLPIAAPVWSIPSSGWAWFILGIVVVGGALRGYADILAYAKGEASVLAPITYLRLVLIGGSGFVFYNEVPDRPTLVGAAIIIAATLYIARREARLRK
ncbi:MAG: DMT family transporter [Pseudomonadota bacterium]